VLKLQLISGTIKFRKLSHYYYCLMSPVDFWYICCSASMGPRVPVDFWYICCSASMGPRVAWSA
jgi:hypothetical protein